MSGTRYEQILQDQITQAARDGHSGPQIDGDPAAATKDDGKLDAPEQGYRDPSERGHKEHKVSMGEKISGALHSMMGKGHKQADRSSKDSSTSVQIAPAPHAERFPAPDPAPIPIPARSEGNTNAFPSPSSSPSRKYLPGAEPTPKSQGPQGHTLPRILPAPVASALHPTIAPEHILVNPLRGSPAGAVASPERAAGEGVGAGGDAGQSVRRGSGGGSSGDDKPKPGPHGPLPASKAPQDTSLLGLTPISPPFPTPTSPTTRPQDSHSHTHSHTHSHFSPPTPTYAHYHPHSSIASADEYGSTVSEAGSVPPSAPPSVVVGSVPAGSAAAFEAWRNAGVLDPFPTPPASGTPHVAGGGSERRSTSAERGKSAYDALNGFPTAAHVAHVEHVGSEGEGERESMEGDEGLRLRELRGYGHGRGAELKDEGQKAGEAAEGVGRLMIG